MQLTLASTTNTQCPLLFATILAYLFLLPTALCTPLIAMTEDGPTKLCSKETSEPAPPPLFSVSPEKSH